MQLLPGLNIGATPESELLFACIRWSIDPNSAGSIPQFASRISDWQVFLGLADEHSLGPIAADCLIHSGIDLPEPEGALLQPVLRENAKRGLVGSSELIRIVQCLEREGIGAIALKGPALAARYRDPAHRVFSDLDLVIPREDLERARKILAREGYRECANADVLRIRYKFLRWTNALVFEHPTSRISIDLHWELTPPHFPVHLPLAEIRAHAETVCVDGQPLLTLSREDYLLFLCIHGTKHAWPVLSQLADICMLIATAPTLDYARLLGRARAAGADRMVWFGLVASGVLLNHTVPPLDSLIADAPREITRKVAEYFRQRLLPARPFSDDDPAMRFGMLLGRPSVRASFFLALLFTPTEADWFSLPPLCRDFFYLCYPWRVLRIVRRRLS